MKNIFSFILVVTFNLFCFGQNQNPKYVQALPISTGYEYIGHKDLHVGKEGSELFFANIDSNTSLGYIKTKDFPDCLLAVNQFGGNDIYKKLNSGKFQRIIHVKNISGSFKVYYVDDDNNISKLVLSTEESNGSNSYSATLLGYTFYWNNL